MMLVSLVLFFVFRRKFYCLSVFGSRVYPEVYDKSFTVFNPYSEVSVFHRFIVLIPIVVWYSVMLLLYFFFAALKSGLILPIVLGIVCLNMLPLDVAFEIYGISTVFMRALQRGVKFGVGDIEVLKKLNRVLRKVSDYCLGLSIFFLIAGLLLPAIWYQLFSGFSSFVSSFPDFSSFGLAGIPLLVFLIAVMFVFVGFLASMVKGRIFKFS